MMWGLACFSKQLSLKEGILNKIYGKTMHKNEK